MIELTIKDGKVKQVKQIKKETRGRKRLANKVVDDPNYFKIKSREARILRLKDLYYYIEFGNKKILFKNKKDLVRINIDTLDTGDYIIC